MEYLGDVCYKLSVSVQIDEHTIAGFLQSLGLSKYLITFQAEEVFQEELYLCLPRRLAVFPWMGTGLH